MFHLLQELRRASELVVLVITIYNETHLLGFHGCAVTHKLIKKSNSTVPLNLSKELQHRTVEGWRQVIQSRGPQSGGPQENFSSRPKNVGNMLTHHVKLCFKIH
ncbi:hypothetical protein TNCV_4845191 [Trichonephila clavipes]|uniref:Uncharacterized protein n=1 Tax=Trichonephila clavipes TaxID=2585209 RepID=A0A8X6WKF9_TRICX|nr:hypothetical protein TNCV_4845191 [Trichonephila clavipes]